MRICHGKGEKEEKQNSLKTLKTKCNLCVHIFNPEDGEPPLAVLGAFVLHSRLEKVQTIASEEDQLNWRNHFLINFNYPGSLFLPVHSGSGKCIAHLVWPLLPGHFPPFPMAALIRPCTHGLAGQNQYCFSIAIEDAARQLYSGLIINVLVYPLTQSQAASNINDDDDDGNGRYLKKRTSSFDSVETKLNRDSMTGLQFLICTATILFRWLATPHSHPLWTHNNHTPYSVSRVLNRGISGVFPSSTFTYKIHQFYTISLLTVATLLGEYKERMTRKQIALDLQRSPFDRSIEERLIGAFFILWLSIAYHVSGCTVALPQTLFTSKYSSICDVQSLWFLIIIEQPYKFSQTIEITIQLSI